MRVTRPARKRLDRSESLKDEVYRQMFRLEESRPGAEVGLALELFRAWLGEGPKLGSDQERDWLKKISAICLEMIEASLRTEKPAGPRELKSLQSISAVLQTSGNPSCDGGYAESSYDDPRRCDLN